MRLLLLLVLLLFAQPGFAALIEGRVVDGENPVSGIQVAAYPSLDPDGTPLAVSEPTDEDGTYRLDLPAGYVALYAHDAASGRFAFCGRNPVQVSEAKAAWAGLQLVPLTAVVQQAYDDDYSTGLEGQVLFAGQPLAGALVHLYLDVAEDLKGQGYRLSLPTAEDGYFAFHNLPESDYFLVVRKRNNGERLGPLLEGDLLGVHSGNPLKLQAGKLAQVKVSVVRKLKAGGGSETPNRIGRFRLKGKIVDSHGKPQSGLHVFAYREKVIGHNRPAGLSPVTGADGRFEVNLPEARIYYVGARESYGDSPAPGELFGMYEGSADHGLQIKAGEAEEIRIEVVPVTLE
jgi:hypothetical protein